MKDRVKVMLKKELEHSELKPNVVGYVDSYIKGADDRPYAIVVIEDVIDMVQLFNLKVVK